MASGCTPERDIELFIRARPIMRPTAAAQVIEAVIKLAAGYMLAAALSDTARKRRQAARFFGVTIGVAATAMLMAMYMYDKRRTPAAGRIRKRELLSDILSVALPILAAATIANAMSVIDTTVTRTRLLDAVIKSRQSAFFSTAHTWLSQ